jgi:hypothetical protein
LEAAALSVDTRVSAATVPADKDAAALVSAGAVTVRVVSRIQQPAGVTAEAAAVMADAATVLADAGASALSMPAYGDFQGAADTTEAAEVPTVAAEVPEVAADAAKFAFAAKLPPTMSGGTQQST